jgi:lipase ATG15
MNLVDGATEQELWKNQARLSEIVGNITRGRSRNAWMAVLGGFSFVFVALFLGAVGAQEENTAADQPYEYLPDFTYLQKDSLQYPTCELTSDLGESPLTSMADYAFLAGLAYRDVEGTQGALDGWFGLSDINATDRNDVVEMWRADNDVQASVSFKLVTVPGDDGNVGDYAYVLIRGTQNNWDMLTDVQLWGAAALMQALRALLPLGEIWTPIIAQLIQVINTVESSSIERVSFYKVTTKFVKYLQKETDYIGVGVTGHSLGGGLAIITGAQTMTPAVALSGPNAMLTRRSLDPPVSSGDLDSQTFNIIPERDVVPMLDDVAQNFQHIRCNTGANDPIGCHDSTRSLCELLFTCGSKKRPTLCECVQLFGYPEPDPTGNRTFDEACPGL